MPGALWGARPVEAAQQLVSEQIILATYARSHSDHTGLHLKRWYSQIWGTSQKGIQGPLMFQNFCWTEVSKILASGFWVFSGTEEAEYDQSHLKANPLGNLSSFSLLLQLLPPAAASLSCCSFSFPLQFLPQAPVTSSASLSHFEIGF